MGILVLFTVKDHEWKRKMRYWSSSIWKIAKAIFFPNILMKDLIDKYIYYSKFYVLFFLTTLPQKIMYPGGYFDYYLHLKSYRACVIK